MSDSTNKTLPRFSATFDPHTLAEIRRAAATGIYDIRGAGTKRKLPHFDDLLFLGASISRYPLEGYREKCGTDVVLGTRFAKKPIHLKTPITIAGMSFGALSGRAKEALGRGASLAGTSTTTGDGGMTPEERGQSQTLVYQYLPSRYGMNPDDLRKADAIEVVIGQGAKPGGGGMLLGQKISPRVAKMRCLPQGIDQRSACRHPDWTGPDDLEIKIAELREITDWEKPIYVKVGATRPYYDTALAERLDPVLAGRRLANYLAVMTMEAQVIARACGKSHLHNLEPEDLVALTMESAAMAQVPLAGTGWIPGKTGF